LAFDERDFEGFLLEALGKEVAQHRVRLVGVEVFRDVVRLVPARRQASAVRKSRE